MDADGIGGSVNIITKTAKSETPEINALVSGGYSDLRGTTNYQGSFLLASDRASLALTSTPTIISITRVPITWNLSTEKDHSLVPLRRKKVLIITMFNIPNSSSGTTP